MKELVSEIHAINHSWKLSKETFGDDYSLTISLRNLKTRLQVRLLRNYSPHDVYLTIDHEIESSEPTYSLNLINRTNNYQNAAHLPVRVAKEMLMASELKKFTLNQG